MKSGSLCVDYKFNLPDKGIVEIVGYPGSGISSIMKEMARVNSDKSVLYVGPGSNNEDIPSNTIYTSVGLLETAVNFITKTIDSQLVDIVMMDSLPDFVSSREISIVLNEGIQKIDRALTSKIWFEALRILAHLLSKNEALLVIGNIRKTRIPKKTVKEYVSTIARQSAQSLDKYESMRLMLEIAKRKSNGNGVTIYVDNWIKDKAHKGLPIPIVNGKIRHDIEKYLILSSIGKVRKIGKEVYAGDKIYKVNEFLKDIGNDYSFDAIVGIENFLD